MKKLLHILLGTVRVVVTGPYPERVLNLCAQARIDFWGVDWRDDSTVAFTLRRRGLEPARDLARRVDCTTQILYRSGFPEAADNLARRYGFLVGLALSLAVVCILSQFVLTVEVAGNEQVDEGVILQQLQRFGVYPGVYGPGLDRRQIEQELLRELPQLSWAALNLTGTRLEVLVREREEAPERIDDRTFSHVVAEADGIVTRVEAELGDALVQPGDTVSRGEVLISGTVTLEPPKYSDLPNRYYQTHARGRVWARTWRTLTAVIPVEAGVKTYTGEGHTGWAIKIFSKTIEISGNSSIPEGIYDKITEVFQLRLPGGRPLPLSLLREYRRPYTLSSVPIRQEEAIHLLEGALQARLEELIGEEGEVLSCQFTTRIHGGLLQVTVQGECREEIGREVPGQP